MKLDCGPSWEEKKKRLEDWHPYFLWLPVRLGSHDCRWLESIERKGTFHAFPGDCYWTWEYRSQGDAG